jgi:hypothetical protein
MAGGKSSGRRPIPISRLDVERAMAHTKSNIGASKYLGISLTTYKIAAERYTNDQGVTLFEAHKNKSGKGIPKLTARKNGEPLLMDILEGRVTSQWFSLKRVKERLIEEGYIEYCCNRCGYKESRAMDEKIPLILSFLNSNKKDWRLENMEFLCYNCYFINVGDVFDKQQLDALETHLNGTAKKITQFEVPPQFEDAIAKHQDFNNVHNRDRDVPNIEEGRPEDYGSDLIAFVKSK